MQKTTASLSTAESPCDGRVPSLGVDRGAAAIEYGIMVALISAVLIATLAMTGNSLNALFYQVAFMFGGIQ